MIIFDLSLGYKSLTLLYIWICVHLYGRRPGIVMAEEVNCPSITNFNPSKRLYS